ncbi:MAG TPA: hypothetical protein VLH39_00445 [Magnetospirillaceae bacterium]|nr:hypothetical protein [Magnetospirillaceae bacterium]
MRILSFPSRSLLAALASLYALSAAALQWPVADGSPALTFGSFRSGRFLPSITVGPAGAVIRAAAEGDVVFRFDGDMLPSGLPSTLGSFVALSHAGGLVSVYSRLEPGSLPAGILPVPSGKVLGGAGGSGFYSMKESGFTLYDLVKRRYLNPLVLLSPARDDRAPVVRGFYLSSGGRNFPLPGTRSFRQGAYEFLADIWDPPPAADARPRAPYEIRLAIDGQEVVRFIYDTAHAESGRLTFFEPLRVDSRTRFFPDGTLRLGSFMLSRGRSAITLTVSDYAGNERVVTATVLVE